MKKAFLVYPHQLFEDIHALKVCDMVILVEEPLFFSEFRFHKQKLVLHRASMKAYERFLEEQGIPVTYIESHQIKTTGYIAELLTQKRIASVSMYDPVDNWLSSRIVHACSRAGLELSVLDTPMFLTKQSDLRSSLLLGKARVSTS